VKTIETMRVSRHANSLALVGLVAVGVVVSGSMAAADEPAQPVQGEPHYRTGDTWTYRSFDPLSKESKTFTQTAVLVRPDGSASLQIGNGSARIELTTEANLILDRSDQQACGIVLHFPLRVGTHYEADCRAASTTGMTIVRRAQSEVEDIETVNTKAGSFSTIKVKMTGIWSPLSGTGGGPMEETMWYAPAVKRVVRDEYQIRLAGKGVPATRESELVRYSVKP
jgi:hypothetical protein